MRVLIDDERRQISPGKNDDLPLMSPPHLRPQLLAISDFALSGKLVQLRTPDAIRVPRREGLPPASFRLHLTMDALALS